MMRQQPSVTEKRPSRLCRLLLLLVGFKLALLGVVLFEPEMNLDFLLPAQDDVLEAWQRPAEPVQSANAVQPVSPTQAVQAPPASSVRQSAAPAAQQYVASAGRQENALNSAQASALPSGKSSGQATVSRRAPGVAFAATPESITQTKGQPQSSLSLEALNRRQEELARKEQDIKQLQGELDERFAQLQALEQRLKIMLKDADEMKGARYRHLVDVLANMKARQAAEVLATLDEKIAVRVLAGMQGRQAGEILSFADPVKAARLTEALARMQMPLE